MPQQWGTRVPVPRFPTSCPVLLTQESGGNQHVRTLRGKYYTANYQLNALVAAMEENWGASWGGSVACVDTVGRHLDFYPSTGLNFISCHLHLAYRHLNSQSTSYTSVGCDGSDIQIILTHQPPINSISPFIPPFNDHTGPPTWADRGVVPEVQAE